MEATKCRVIIDNQYSISLYYHLHPEVLWLLNSWSTTTHVIWVMDDVARSSSHAFGRQFAACWSFHKFFISIAWLPHLSSSISFFSICMMYHREFQISQPWAPGLSGELCSWMHGWMHHDGRPSDRFVSSTGHSSYDPDDITYWNVARYCHHCFRFCFLTAQ